MNNYEKYQPLGTHINFEIPEEHLEKEEEPEKKAFYYINKNDELIGKYYAKNVFWASKKIFTQIFRNTGIKNPIYEVYDEDNDIIYKYAGQVKEKRKNKIKYIEDNEKIKKIVERYEYTIRQISKQKRKIKNEEL